MDRDRLIADVHRETGIQLDEADPLLAAAVINERMLDASLADLRKLVNGAAVKLAAVGVANEAAAKRLASEVVNSAAEYLGTQFAYSDETARVYRSETARRSDLKAPTIPVSNRPGWCRLVGRFRHVTRAKSGSSNCRQRVCIGC